MLRSTIQASSERQPLLGTPNAAPRDSYKEGPAARAAFRRGTQRQSWDALTTVTPRQLEEGGPPPASPLSLPKRYSLAAKALGAAAGVSVVEELLAYCVPQMTAGWMLGAVLAFKAARPELEYQYAARTRLWIDGRKNDIVNQTTEYLAGASANNSSPGALSGLSSIVDQEQRLIDQQCRTLTAFPAQGAMLVGALLSAAVRPDAFGIPFAVALGIMLVAEGVASRWVRPALASRAAAHQVESRAHLETMSTSLDAHEDTFIEWHQESSDKTNGLRRIDMREQRVHWVMQMTAVCAMGVCYGLKGWLQSGEWDHAMRSDVLTAAVAGARVLHVLDRVPQLVSQVIKLQNQARVLGAQLHDMREAHMQRVLWQNLKVTAGGDVCTPEQLVSAWHAKEPALWVVQSRDRAQSQLLARRLEQSATGAATLTADALDDGSVVGAGVENPEQLIMFAEEEFSAERVAAVPHLVRAKSIVQIVSPAFSEQSDLTGGRFND